MAATSSFGGESGRAVPELQETLLGQAFEHGQLAAIVLDEEGTVLAANLRATEISGYPRAELLGLGCAGLDAELGTEERLQAMAEGTVTAGRTELRCADGARKAVEYRLGPTKVGGLPFFLAVFWEPV